jgi:hypothetical protein
MGTLRHHVPKTDLGSVSLNDLAKTSQSSTSEDFPSLEASAVVVIHFLGVAIVGALGIFENWLSSNYSSRTTRASLGH